VSSDGQRFLMLTPGGAQEMAPTQTNVVLNWFDGVTALGTDEEMIAERR
jgi:hypothetical protein